MLILFLIASQIDLNRASLDEIYTLPIDSTLAYRIYEYRELYGDFTSIYDLRNVKGIDGEVFETIKSLIKIVVGFVPRTEWGSILAEQEKLASEEPPSKAAIDEWEYLIRSPMNINEATFDDLLMIDRMTPIDASAVMRHLQVRHIQSTRDLQRVKGLSYYAYTSLRKYVQFADEPEAKKPIGGVRLKAENESRFDIGEEDENLATRISYLESAVSAFETLATNLKQVYEWTDLQCEVLRDHLIEELDTLKKINAEPQLNARLRINYQKKLRIGLHYSDRDRLYKGYVGISHLGLINRFYLGNYRVVWGEGLMIDNSDEYRPRIYSRSVGIFGDLTENFIYDLFGAAGSFRIPLFHNACRVAPSFFYSTTNRDAIINPDNTVWRIYQDPIRFSSFANRLHEEIYGVWLGFSPFERTNPGTEIAFEAMAINYDKPFNPDVKWIDEPLDKYDPLNYPEITALSKNQKRIFYGISFIFPIANAFISGELVRQHDTLNQAYALLIKGRIQYEFLYLNLLFRHYDIGYDNPFHRGFSEYRRFEDTPFEKPYALVDPEFASIYDDPTPKPEQGFFMETRFQLTRNIILTRAYLDLFRNLSHSLINQRGYFEFEFRPVWAVRIRYSQKYIRKHLPKPILPTLSKTHESTLKVFFYLSNYDALRVETRFGNVDLTATEGDDLDLSGGYLSFSFEHNFLSGFSIEGGCVLWATDGMSQWIFEDVGIDFLSADGMKYYVIASQKIGSMLAKIKFRQKFTQIPHTGLHNNEDIYYPELPGIRVHDFINQENSTLISLQLDYMF